MHVHLRNGMVQSKLKSRGSKDDPFILASQAQHIYYLYYVSCSGDHKQWCVAMKSNTRSRVDWTHMLNVDVSAFNTEDIFQEERQPLPVPADPTNDVDIVEEGVFVILEEEVDDVVSNHGDGSDCESDYRDRDDDDEEGYFGKNNSDNSSEDD
ncbi:hypothetical protein LIER_34963 [Lithospermum erythrorhizon]|uniref:DUF4216 domain-containing protein n=1 Tax=Lithospermum erythrorhizon TaxID=34254 RepID=A0AAV3NKP9_LITER